MNLEQNFNDAMTCFEALENAIENDDLDEAKVQASSLRIEIDQYLSKDIESALDERKEMIEQIDQLVEEGNDLRQDVDRLASEIEELES